MRTTSGAHVLAYGQYCGKMGAGKIGTRIEAQAEYMELLGTNVCPRVLARWPRGYMMERLVEVPRPVNPSMYVTQATWILGSEVWVRSPLTSRDDWQQHFDYVLSRAFDWCPDLSWRALDIVSSVNVNAATRCLTHGDPTCENMMYGRARTFLADPLPPTAYMPECREVDLGKMVQSLLGYEDLKYDGQFWSQKMPVAGRVLQLADRVDLTLSQWQLTLWFAFTHCVRLLPYQPKDRLWDYRQLAGRALELLEDECA